MKGEGRERKSVADKEINTGNGGRTESQVLSSKRFGGGKGKGVLILRSSSKGADKKKERKKIPPPPRPPSAIIHDAEVVQGLQTLGNFRHEER